MIAAVAALLLQAQNPEYRYWADRAPGAWSRMNISSSQGGIAFEGEVKATLVSISAERATVERTTKMKIGERTVEETSREEVKAAEAKTIVRESDAELKVGGRTLPCRLYEMKQDKGKVRMDVKWWASSEIPGGLARLEMIPEGATQAIITIVAVEWGAAAKK
jgi:hypothetical protein